MDVEANPSGRKTQSRRPRQGTLPWIKRKEVAGAGAHGGRHMQDVECATPEAGRVQLGQSTRFPVMRGRARGEVNQHAFAQVVAHAGKEALGLAGLQLAAKDFPVDGIVQFQSAKWRER